MSAETAVFVWPVVDESVPAAELLDEARGSIIETATASRIVLPEQPEVRGLRLVPGRTVSGSGGAAMCVVCEVPGASKMPPRPYHRRRPGVAGLLP